MRIRLAGLCGLLTALTVAAGQPTASKQTWVYGHNILVRKGGEKDFTKDTSKIGVEFFKDDTGGALVAITQTGNLAVVPATLIGNEKKPQWLFAHDLRCRRADEERFTKDTMTYGVEALKDMASGKLMYLSQKASIALTDAPASLATDQGPKWHHALILKVRLPAEDGWTNAKKFGIEVFKDGNTGGLIYVTELGTIALAPAPNTVPDPEKIKPPKYTHGFNLRVRKADEPNFGPMTRKVGVEVFQDQNTGGLVYISETGSIATAPAPSTIQAGNPPEWKHAMTLKARPSSVNEFDKANKFGIEVFLDVNTGYLVYISETGSIAVLATKK